MTHIERQNKRKAIIGAILLHILILVGFYFLKLDYSKKIENRGIAINLGYVTDMDASNVQSVVSKTNTVKSVPAQKKQSIKEKLPDIADVDVVTQDNVETIAVDKSKEAHVETEEVIKEDTPVELVPEEQVLDENLKDLIDILGRPGDKTSTGDNNSEVPSGNPDGQKNGDQNSKILGSGTQKNGYDLGNRRALNTPNPNYDCNEIGVVVVRVWVNAEGVTIKAEAGVRGSTETSACLVREAKDAALRTLWAPDPEAQTQIGTITYNFYKR